MLFLGSNLGNREDYLQSGIRGLAKRHIDIIRCASVYSTEPREVLDQPWFLNTVLEASTVFGAEELLRACLDIEQENLRRRDTSKGPRTLDVDIIFYGNEVIQRPGLTIPHPSFSARRFVLAPLAEVTRNFLHPVLGQTVSTLLAALQDSHAVRRLEEALVPWTRAGGACGLPKA